MVGLDEASAQAIRDLDEHWDGRGYPLGLSGDAISLLGRVLCLAQTMEVFWQDGGPDAACAVARERAGTWFDPVLANVAASLEHDAAFWASLEDGDVGRVEPRDHVLHVDEAGLDRLCSAFARIIDAKSPYTARHSDGVAWMSAALGDALGLDAGACTTLRRAGLLHDIGKLGVSSRILDKPGSLDADEWDAMRLHPGLTFEILDRVDPFRGFAFTAAAHHERLDGSGYHLGIDGSQLDLPARILAVADVAEALSATRPYRDALSVSDVLAIVRHDAGRRLDATVVDALDDVLPGWLDASAPPTTQPLAA
jgi:HD-GYP domain-containing protein (c-di-GMP phosphodiesterase class II)